MAMLLLLLSLGCSIAALVANIIVLVHAFQKDPTSGLLCLCVPCYILYYMFTEFEHEQKTLVITVALAGGVAAQALSGIAQNL